MSQCPMSMSCVSSKFCTSVLESDVGGSLILVDGTEADHTGNVPAQQVWGIQECWGGGTKRPACQVRFYDFNK